MVTGVSVAYGTIADITISEIDDTGLNPKDTTIQVKVGDVVKIMYAKNSMANYIQGKINIIDIINNGLILDCSSENASKIVSIGIDSIRTLEIITGE